LFIGTITNKLSIFFLNATTLFFTPVQVVLKAISLDFGIRIV